MSLSLTPMTELEAVNRMLFTIGETPINTIENSGLVDAVTARQVLAQASRDTQLVGWEWNSEEDYPLVPSFPEGEIILPPNTLKVDTSGVSADLNLVQRGTRLYDRKNHTYAINQTVYVDIVLLLPFEELPEAARSYISIKAARQFQAGFIGSDTLFKFTQYDEQTAWKNLIDAESEGQDLNILDNSSVAKGLIRSPR